jgi:hypothetical protein
MHFAHWAKPKRPHVSALKFEQRFKCLVCKKIVDARRVAKPNAAQDQAGLPNKIKASGPQSA